MQVVSYYMKGHPLQSQQFETLPEAKAFIKALASNPNCESYKLER